MVAMMKKDDLKVAADTLVGFIADALTKGGLPRDDARNVGELMIAADLLGGDGHGIFRLPRYLDRLKAGGFKRIRRSAWTAATARRRCSMATTPWAISS